MLDLRKERTETLKGKYRRGIKELRIGIWKLVTMIPAIWDMSYDDFCFYFFEETKRTEEAIKKYAQRGIPKDITYDKLSKYIENIFQRYIEDEEDYSSLKKREKAKIQWEKQKEGIMGCISVFYEQIESMSSDMKEPYMSSDFQYYNTLQLFMKGLWPQKNHGLNEEDIKFLRLALERFPPSFTRRKKPRKIKGN